MVPGGEKITKKTRIDAVEEDLQEYGVTRWRRIKKKISCVVSQSKPARVKIAVK